MKLNLDIWRPIRRPTELQIPVELYRSPVSGGQAGDRDHAGHARRRHGAASPRLHREGDGTTARRRRRMSSREPPRRFSLDRAAARWHTRACRHRGCVSKQRGGAASRAALAHRRSDRPQPAGASVDRCGAPPLGARQVSRRACRARRRANGVPLRQTRRRAAASPLPPASIPYHICRTIPNTSHHGDRRPRACAPPPARSSSPWMLYTSGAPRCRRGDSTPGLLPNVDGLIWVHHRLRHSRRPATSVCRAARAARPSCTDP